MKHWRNKTHNKKTNGQSLVEMSFVLPLLLILLFGIIDISYYVYCYATIYQSARRGSDLAAFFPPYKTRLDGTAGDPDAYDMADECVNAIVTGTRIGATLVDLTDIDVNRDKFSITYYPAPDLLPDPNDDYKDHYRDLGKTVQVAITYTIEPLTPLFGLVPVFGNEGKMTVYATSMRSIIGQGEALPGSSSTGLRICER